MTIERILIAVLFLLMVRAEINFVKLAKSHNDLTDMIAILTLTVCTNIKGFADDLDANMMMHVDGYRKTKMMRERGRTNDDGQH